MVGKNYHFLRAKRRFATLLLPQGSNRHRTPILSGLRAFRDATYFSIRAETGNARELAEDLEDCVAGGVGKQPPRGVNTESGCPGPRGPSGNPGEIVKKGREKPE